MVRKPWMMVLLLLMGTVTLALIGMAAYLLLGKNLPLSSSGALHAYVQAAPDAAIGAETELIVTVRNNTGGYVSIDEIRLPDILLDSATVASILPGTLSKTEYDGQTGYQIGFLMAPDDQREFVIKLLPNRVDDILGDVSVLAGGGKWKAVTGFRLTFVQAVVELDATAPVLAAELVPSAVPTETILLPTATPTQDPIPYGGVVKITAQVKHSSYLRDVWSGSGTIISPEGLILTNAHLVDPGQMLYSDFFKISITDDPAVAPTDYYFAKPMVIDEDLDLAVLLITTDLKYKPIDMDELDLTVVPLGDSSKLKLGDPLVIIGYPGIGGKTITLTRGDVGGFTVFGQDPEPSFIKTSATISGGTSGGAVFDQFGRLVGIPTQLGYGADEGDLVDCRIIADTNGDGSVNSRDACVPVGGFINALRPINLAASMIEEAKKMISFGGIPYPSPTP